MSARFQELDWRPTPLGELVLRRRWDPRAGQEVYEIKLGDEFLMSSLFTVAEVQLAVLALAELGGDALDVVVGGLGLGYTAQTVLESAAVRSLVVIEALDEVIDWHRRGMLPAGGSLTTDPRCRLVHGDFFGMLRGPSQLAELTPARRFHAIIVDIDHSPRHVLHPSHADLYNPAGLHRLAAHLHPGGVFALWSNDPPDDAFTAALAEQFVQVKAEIVRFGNPLQDGDAANTVYLARYEPSFNAPVSPG